MPGRSAQAGPRKKPPSDSGPIGPGVPELLDLAPNGLVALLLEGEVRLPRGVPADEAAPILAESLEVANINLAGARLLGFSTIEAAKGARCADWWSWEDALDVMVRLWDQGSLRCTTTTSSGAELTLCPLQLLCDDDYVTGSVARLAPPAPPEGSDPNHPMVAVGQLAGGIAHGMNNLLTAISGYCDMLLNVIGSDDPLSADVEGIRKAGERATALTRQLLAFSRRQALQPGSLDLDDLILETQLLLERVGEPLRVEVSPAAQFEVPVGGTETILLVEDEGPVRTLLRDVLERQGYEVLEAVDGEDALELAVGWPKTIHLMVTDVVMPRLNGVDLAKRLGSARPEMKVLFVSGYTQDAIRPADPTEEIAFLGKPFTPDELLLRIRELLDG